MSLLMNKIDFAVIMTVDHANPNGDPLNGNRPRITYSGNGEISDVCINYKRIRVYYGNSKNDAIKARLEAEAKYYGKFAPQRHLFEQYGITQQNDLNEIESIENLTTEETNDDCI